MDEFFSKGFEKRPARGLRFSPPFAPVLKTGKRELLPFSAVPTVALARKQENLFQTSAFHI